MSVQTNPRRVARQTARKVLAEIVCRPQPVPTDEADAVAARLAKAVAR